jgi:predicted regulator of Ras-like GTPase activity (Roadblock/LC7/MglB family)
VDSVGQILDELLSFSDVRSALLAAREGLVIQMRGETAVDGETLAAIVPNLINDSVEAAEAMGGGGFRQGVFEFEDGLLVLTSVDGDHFLAVAVRGGANIGELLYALERERGRLKELA